MQILPFLKDQLKSSCQIVLTNTVKKKEKILAIMNWTHLEIISLDLCVISCTSLSNI